MAFDQHIASISPLNWAKRLLRHASSDDGPDWPLLTPGVKSARLPNLAKRFLRRRWFQKDLRDFLPADDVDFAPLFEAVQDPPERVPAGSRIDIAINTARLQKQFRGRPQILFMHALLISYLRRNSDHTARARRLYFRLWKEHGARLLPMLNNRWLISALQTFHDHGQTEHQRRIGSVGWIYANLLKFAEMERSYCGQSPDEIYPDQKINRMGIAHCGAADLDRTDAMLNTNALIYELSFLDPVAGPILEELMVRIHQSRTVFYRMDATRAALDLNPDKFADYGCFATPYPGSAQEKRSDDSGN